MITKINNKAQALVAAIIILIILALFAAVIASLLGAQTGQAATGLIQSTQALYLAHAGLEWYLEQLADDNDWTDEVDQIGLALATGTFDINIDESTLSPVSVDFTVTGKVMGYDGRNRERFVKVTAKKTFPGTRFAVFWQEDGPGTQLVFANGGGGTHIAGDFWCRGSSTIGSNSDVTNGWVYYGATETVSGTGSYTAQAVQPPFPAMPALDPTGYDDLINSFNNTIDSVPSGARDKYQVNDLTLAGGVFRYKNFITNGDITISGNGYIVASKSIRLHSDDSASGTLTITPSGGNIYFLAGEDIIVNSARDDTNVIINAGAYLYSRSQTNTFQLIKIQKHAATTTNIDSAFIIGNRRVIVQNGADITNSVLYVNYASSNQNNLLQITGSGTTVSGSVVSRGRAHPSLQINNGAQVTGLVYQYANNIRGRAQVDGNSLITGALLVRQFHNDSLGPATITGDLSSLPSPLPMGFEDFEVYIDSDSWDGL